MRTNLPVTQHEIELKPGQTIVSKTTPKGVITYVNRDFVEISGFTESELIGQAHNIVRHPDMPQAAFEDLWHTVNKGRPWRGIVKNRCKNGDYYWVEANVTPIWENGRVVEYMSVRSKPSPQQIQEAESLYRRLNAGDVVRPAPLERLRNLVGNAGLLTKAVALLAVIAMGAFLGTAHTWQLLSGLGMQLGPEQQQLLADTRSALIFTNSLVLLATLVAVLWFVQACFVRPMDWLKSSLLKMSCGDFSTRIDISRQDEMGQVMQSLQCMQVRLGFEVEDTKRVANEASRVRRALDVASTNVMLADEDYNIIYMNRSLEDMMANAEADLQTVLPDFRADDLMGKNMDVFHRDPQHQRKILSQATALYEQEVEVAGRTIVIKATPVFDDQGQRLGTVIEWLDRTEELAMLAEEQRQEEARLAKERQVAHENARIRQALDAVSANVMVADRDGRIVYANEAVTGMMKRAETDIRTELTDFSSDHLLGSNIDIYHKNPAHQQGMLRDMSGEISSRFVLGGRTLQVVANPIRADDNQQIGVVVEWSDLTDEVAIQQELDSLIQNAALGNLGVRADIEGRQGFFLKVSEGLNTLMAICEGVIGDVVTSLEALSTGDLTRTIDKDYEGQFGELKDNLNNSMGHLASIVSEIRFGATSVLNGANEIAQGNADLSQRTEEQASSLEETASSMEEMTGGVRDNARSALQVEQQMERTREEAVKGEAISHQAVAAINEINQSSKRIADIIGVIDEIAFQTNLLALNAAVEAARAGEQGRGFAVVAAEVRNLAQRSAGAAKEIKDLIKDSVAKVEDGTRFVNATGQTLATISESVSNVSKAIQRLATTVNEQSTGIGQVNVAVGQMDEMTQQNAALVEQASAASEAMAEQARNLEQQVAFFKLPDDAGARRNNAPSVNQTVATSVRPSIKPGMSSSPVASEDHWEEF